MEDHYFVSIAQLGVMTVVIMIEFASVVVNLTNKRSYVWRARKSENYKYDDDDKQRVIDILWQEFGIAAVRGDPIETASGRRRIPDLRTTNHCPAFYVELDGDYHGFGDDLTTSDATFRRNEDYERLGAKLIVINKSESDGYSKKFIVEKLKILGIKDQRL